MPTVPAAILATLALATAAGAVPPAADAPLPRTVSDTVRALEGTTSALNAAIDGWRASRMPRPSSDVVLDALFLQRLYRRLSGNAALGNAVLRRLRPPIASFARDVVVAHRELVRITPPLRAPRIRVGPAAPPDELLRFYRAAQRRFGVAWNVLAAVNFVESAFGKLRSASAAGAQGPMQFMPDTWRRYGLGGDVHDPHDAVLGAANYLRASGARTNVRRALHEYNPSPSYVDAVLRYARRIRADPRGFYTLYSWQVFVRTTSGVRRVTGPGLP